jgi:hypothetical protein
METWRRISDPFLEINGHEDLENNHWFFCRQVVMKTSRILMDTYGDMEASWGHRDFHGNLEKHCCFLFEKFKTSWDTISKS